MELLHHRNGYREPTSAHYDINERQRAITPSVLARRVPDRDEWGAPLSGAKLDENAIDLAGENGVADRCDIQGNCTLELLGDVLQNEALTLVICRCGGRRGRYP